MAAIPLVYPIYQLGAMAASAIAAMWLSQNPPKLPSIPLPGDSSTDVPQFTSIGQAAQAKSKEARDRAIERCGDDCLEKCDPPIGTVCAFVHCHKWSRTHGTCDYEGGGHIHLYVRIAIRDCQCGWQDYDPEDIGAAACFSSATLPAAVIFCNMNKPACKKIGNKNILTDQNKRHE